jgi:hypothetical protein
MATDPSLPDLLRRAQDGDEAVADTTPRSRTLNGKRIGLSSRSMVTC